MPNVPAFLFYVFVASLTPGPNNIMAMSNASRYGIRKSIMFNVGVSIGFFIVILVNCIFSVTLYSVISSIKPVMTYIGIFYILYLAYKTLKSKGNDEEDSSRIKTSNAFRTGILLQFVNPKGIIYGLTIASNFIAPYYHSPFTIVGFSMFLGLIGFICTCTWGIFGAAFKVMLKKNTKVINGIMALMLVYCAITLLH